MISDLISGAIDGILKFAFGWLSSLLEKRQLIAQGKAQQYTSDLQATVKGATDATQVKNQVNSEPISAVDTDLEQLRQRPTSGQ